MKLTEKQLQQRKDAGKKRLNNEGRQRAIELSRSGLGLKEIARLLRITPRRIRRWRKEEGIPAQVTEKKSNVTMCLKSAWVAEMKVFSVGDESKHWADHPAVVEYRNETYRPRTRAAAKAYYYANKDAIYRRVKADPKRWMALRLRTRMHHVLKGNKLSGTVREVTGCSNRFLKWWIESQFKRGMTWQNYGRAWHIDHIIPCSSFDLSKPEQQRACFHYTNLRPLKAFDNWSKHARVVATQPELTMSISE